MCDGDDTRREPSQRNCTVVLHHDDRTATRGPPTPAPGPLPVPIPGDRHLPAPAGRHPTRTGPTPVGSALDETLDPEEVHDLFAGMEPMHAVLWQSRHYGPRVFVPSDADEQTKLIAFTGRRP